MAQFGLSMGSILIASWFASGLSGVMLLQAYIYYRNRPENDHKLISVLVILLLTLDMCHVACIMATLYHYLIQNFGNDNSLIYLVPPLALTVGLTGTITFFAQCFFTWRVWKLSRGNMIAPVIFCLLVVRMGSGWATTIKAIQYGTFTAFAHQVRWIFTGGISVAVICDVLITGSLCYWLHTSRSALNGMDDMIDKIVLYTVENGLLTSISSIASLICAIIMPGNLVFIAIHFVISKLYINSVLASLNTRNAFRAHKENHPHTPFRGRFLSVHKGRTGSINDNSFVLQSPRPTIRRQGQHSSDVSATSKVNPTNSSQSIEFVHVKSDNTSLDEPFQTKNDLAI